MKNRYVIGAILLLATLCPLFAAKQTINVGTSANDGTGDTLRGAFQKANANFTELYNQLVDHTGVVDFGGTGEIQDAKKIEVDPDPLGGFAQGYFIGGAALGVYWPVAGAAHSMGVGPIAPFWVMKNWGGDTDYRGLEIDENSSSEMEIKAAAYTGNYGLLLSGSGTGAVHVATSLIVDTNASIGGNLTVATNLSVGGYVTNATSLNTETSGYIRLGTSSTSPVIVDNGSTIGIKRASDGSPQAFIGYDTSAYGVVLREGGLFGWGGGGVNPASSADTRLYRDAADTLAIRRTTNPNTFRVYGGYVDSSNFSRASLAHDGTSTTTLAGETAGTGNDDQSLKIKLAGNGALYVDGDTAGNARGANAVDLQVSRSAATQVASSLYSVAIGAWNTASGTSSAALGGVQNVASGENSVALGGSGNTASGAGSLASGVKASTYLYGQQSFASGQFSDAGDAQGSRLVMRNTTTGSSADLFLDGGSARAVIPANTTWMFEITVSARSTDGGTGGEESAAYKYIGCIERDGAGNTALVGTVTETVVAEDDTDWSVVVSADDTNDALDVNVTSDDANTVRWVAVVTLTEVGG